MDPEPDVLEPLRQELHASPPQAFAALGAERVRQLADALRREREAQNAGLTEAAEEALTLVPSLARVPVRKMLFR